MKSWEENSLVRTLHFHYQGPEVRELGSHKQWGMAKKRKNKGYLK